MVNIGTFCYIHIHTSVKSYGIAYTVTVCGNILLDFQNLPSALMDRYLKTFDFAPSLPMLCKALVKQHGKPPFHSNIATIHITIAVQEIISQMTKPIVQG